MPATVPSMAQEHDQLQHPQGSITCSRLGPCEDYACCSGVMQLPWAAVQRTLLYSSICSSIPTSCRAACCMLGNIPKIRVVVAAVPAANGGCTCKQKSVLHLGQDSCVMLQPATTPAAAHSC